MYRTLKIVLLLSVCYFNATSQIVPGIDKLGKIKDKIGKATDKVKLSGAAVTTGIKDTLPGISFLAGQDLGEPKSSETFDLTPGYYKMRVRSYCLHAGNYAPTKGSGYQMAELEGSQAKLIKSILEKSPEHPEIEQHDVQTLIWGIEAGTKFTDYAPEFQLRVKPLLTIKDIALMNVDPSQLVQGMLPEQAQDLSARYEQLRSKMRSAQMEYDDIEEIAVKTGVPPLGLGSKNIEPGIWSYIGNGYFLRATPQGYPTTDIELFRPAPVKIERDNIGRPVKLEKQGLALTINYDDTEIKDANGVVMPVTAIKNFVIKDTKTSEEITLQTDVLIFNKNMKTVSALIDENLGATAAKGGPSADFDASAGNDEITWKDLKRMRERLMDWYKKLKRLEDANDHINEHADQAKDMIEDLGEFPEEVYDDAAMSERVNDGIRTAQNPVDVEGKAHWIGETLKMTIEMAMNSIFRLGGLRDGEPDDKPRRPGLPDYVSQPGNTNMQRIGLSEYQKK